MKVLISGSSGFIGSSLAAFLQSRGHEVVRLVRGSRRHAPASAASVYCDARSGAFNRLDFEGMDAVIHLAGYGIMRRWTPSAKREIERSRVDGTDFLCAVFSALENPPKTFLCASATGFYGDRGDERLDEESACGEGFLARVAQRWENSAKAASSLGIRVANLRFGAVLAKDGGALGMMRLPFKLCLGGTVGDGSAYLSWISRRDAVRAADFILRNDSVSGPVNVVSPRPARNRDFVRAVARAVNRPAFLPIRESVLRLVFGQAGKEVIMSSARVFPRKLLNAGFRFEHEDLQDFLDSELGGRLPEQI